jgi:hypothetical protein
MVIRILLCIFCLSLASFAGSAKPGDDTVTWGSTVEGCRIGVNANKTTYDAAEPIRLVIVLQNQSRPELSESEGSFPYNISIIAPNSNKPAPLTSWGQWLMNPFKIGSSSQQTLTPGDSLTDKLILNRAYDMTMDGTYTIRVSRAIRSETDPKASVWVSSNPITIEVRTQVTN